ncbi:hypothetical protein HGI30_02240 [Paenibacillus albicereus]|uniref:DUF5050 domain-containing protein n=1 Tax=Paenibacillus albicereus TaxID=2726185 RepID=A0A6H2GT02_9BACL|nr:hypothetical protein [Paenibacillus albicereus]QJC50527.1 hypothetical protein HGI30_02240 [Paenibacillus albicereus]
MNSNASRPTKTSLLLLASLLLLLAFGASGCSDKKSFSESNEYDPNFDYPYAFHRQGYALNFAPSEDGYYVTYKNLLYFIDAQRLQPIVLDARPNNGCKSAPTVETCRALVSNEQIFIRFTQVYDERLYTLESKTIDGEGGVPQTEYTLVRMKLDGTSRENVMTFPLRPTTIALHRGYLYFTMTGSDKDGRYTSSVNRVSMENPAGKAEVLGETKDEKAQYLDVLPFGNQIYWHLLGSPYHAYRHDLSSRETIKLWDSSDSGSTNLQALSGDKLYFSRFYGNPNDPRSYIRYQSDLDGSQIQEVATPHPAVLSFLTADSAYLYQMPIIPYLEDAPGVPNRLDIFQKSDSAKAMSVDTSFAPRDFGLLPGDDRYFFATFMSKDGHPLYTALKKADIPSGKAAFTSFMENL